MNSAANQSRGLANVDGHRPGFVVDSSKIKAAQQIVAAAIGRILNLWFAPFVSTLLCNQAERAMVQDILKVLDRDSSAAAVECLFWCVRKKLFVLNLATFIPIAGTAAQVVEVYALGQFTIYCATRYPNLTDGNCLMSSWSSIEEDVLSGDRLVTAYEELSACRFPANIQPKFIHAVDKIRDAYRFAEKSEFFRESQEAAAHLLEIGTREAKDAATHLMQKLANELGRSQPQEKP